MSHCLCCLIHECNNLISDWTKNAPEILRNKWGKCKSDLSQEMHLDAVFKIETY